GVTDGLTGSVDIGPSAFSNSSTLKLTMVHEYGHSVYDRLIDASGNFIDWRSNIRSANSTISKDGLIGYSSEILNAGRLKVGFIGFRGDVNPLWDNYSLFQSMGRGDNYLTLKSLYLIPKRFVNNIT